MSKEKTCTRCHDPQPVANFAWKNKAKGRRHSHCKSCQRPISGKHYSENRSEYIDRAISRYHTLKHENEKKLSRLIADLACARCGEDDPKVNEFTHRAGTDKKDTVRRLLGQSWDVVEAEIAKCELLCANCRKKAA
jgi:hypothetical protein